VIDLDVVGLSRLQFALTALYHFLFVQLTLGLSMILVIMESVYVMTGREIWQRMTRFWGLLFGSNFAMPLGSAAAAPVTRRGPARASGCAASRCLISLRVNMRGARWTSEIIGLRLGA